MECKLNEDSKIVLINLFDGNFGVFKKSTFMEQRVIDKTDILLKISEKSHVEEVATKDSDKVNLIVTCPYECDFYKINFFSINLTNNAVKSDSILSRSIPEKLTTNFYSFLSYESGEFAICEWIIPSWCYYVNDYIIDSLEEVAIDYDSFSFNFLCVDEEKRPNIFCLSIKILNIDTLHVIFKLDDELRFFNNFYRESNIDEELAFFDDSDIVEIDNGTIAFKDFGPGLINYIIDSGIQKSIDQLYEAPKVINSKVKSRILKKLEEVEN